MQVLNYGIDKILGLAGKRPHKKNPVKKAVKQLFLNYKGGTGKTSVSAFYGTYLARTGKKVLMVDLDAQSHLSACFNIDSSRRDKSLYSVLIRNEVMSDIITNTFIPNLQVVPSTISLSAMEARLYGMPLKEFRLRRALAEVERDYDFIIIDSAPNIGLTSLNAILASDEILIPLLADFLSFHGLKILMETLASVQKDFNFYLKKIHIFLNRYNESYAISRECFDAIHKYYPGYSRKTVINESHVIMEATSLGKSVFDIDPDCAASRDIKNLVIEVNGGV